jgi:hypothetical protein
MSYEAESLLRTIMYDIAFLRNALTQEIPPTASCRDCRWHFKDDDSRLRCSSHLGHDYDGTTIGAKIPVWVEPIGCEKWKEKP